ncbi:hypothetical protein N9B82_05510 [Saprospiraceae bacterium]|nr:hypothetical protein [Saprospiraceae bacterium]
MMNDLKKRWERLNSQNSASSTLVEAEWKQIHKHYTKRTRAYHNLSHLQAMFSEFDKYKDHLSDSDVVAYSIYFHDLVYNVLKQNNELKSAEKARFYLIKIAFETKRVGECYEQIVSTKSHDKSNSVIHELDNAFLLDFDLQVLGRSWPEYQVYTEQIRKEYSIYPAGIYKRGRRDAMIQFLDRERIYSTKIFRDQFEEQARSNIEQEIKLLSS